MRQFICICELCVIGMILVWLPGSMATCSTSTSNSQSISNRDHRIRFKFYEDNANAINLVAAGMALGAIFGPGGAVIVGLVPFIGCTFIFDCDPDSQDYVPPSITCPSVNAIVYTEPSQRTAIVTYSEADACDSSGIKSVEQLSPVDLQSGSQFQIGSHTITFIAHDKNGNCNTCSFTFDVVAKTCTYPSRPDGGDVTCADTPPGSNPIFGESCEYSCDIGYDIIGNETITCGANNYYLEGGEVTCQIKTCPAPITPENALLDSCTPHYDYDSVCMFTCMDGFAINYGEPRYMKCGHRKEWIGTPCDCQDVQVPVIETCPDSQTVYLGADLDYAVATWDIPTAVDNVDDSVLVMLKEGQEPGSRFYMEPDNMHTIVYGAQDTAGNRAKDCEFFVIVQEVTCPPIQHAFRLNVTCPDRLVYGKTCYFECEAGYPLIGPTEAVCEITDDDPTQGYWNWGANMSSPLCEVHYCPALPAPINGAMACDNWLHGLTCQMQCNERYDVPRTASPNGQYTCADTEGTWRPDDNVPDCSVTRGGNTMRLPGELFYFSGDCTSAETQAQIKQNFIDTLLGSDFREFCTLYPECSVENVNVTCGETSERRRRNANNISSHERMIRQVENSHEVIITFDFTLNGIYDASMTASEMDGRTFRQFQELNDYLRSYIDVGGMDIEGLEVRPGSFQTSGESLLVCYLGLLVDYSSFKCKPCPSGTYFDISQDDCVACAIGTYQDTDGALNCIDCPSGYSTALEGARHVDQCVATCEIGYYSTNGLKPCAACPLNAFTDQRHQTNCTPCPDDTYTANAASSSLLSCQTQIIPNGPCSTNPCNSHGVCTRRNGSYLCNCADGYSGTNCVIPPESCAVNICQNDGLCQATGEGKDDYECICTKMYTGDYCQHQKVNGAWGDWSKPSECSTTCGPGTQQRYRRCDNPAPNTYGDNCTGEYSITESCTVRECPECSQLERPFGTNVDCAQNGDYTTCTISCRSARMAVTSYPSQLTCGPNTNYTWNPDVGDLPQCTESRFPKRIRYTVRAECSAPDASTSERNSFENDINTVATQELPCLQTGHCTVNIGSDTGSRRKRDIQGFSMTVIAEVGTFDMSNNDSAAQGLVDMAWLITQIEIFATTLGELMQNGSLTLTVDGVEYNTEVTEVKGGIACETGQKQISLFCVNCPPGTYSSDEDCTLCSLGEYQADEGQANCDVCPTGYTTPDFGSKAQSDCVVANRNNQGDNSTTLVTIVAIILSMVLLIIGVAVVGVVFCRLKLRKANTHVVPRRPTSSSRPVTTREVKFQKNSQYGDSPYVNDECDLPPKYSQLLPLDHISHVKPTTN